jgi:elongation factor G
MATPSYTTGDIRNVLLAGHKGSGKTTLLEAMLHTAAAINARGDVAKGTTVSDFEKEEKAHGHSIFSAITCFDFEGRHFNVIDTPGSPELIGAALSCMPAVETVAVVINAAAGIEVVTRKVMEAAAERNLPRAILINHIDAPGVDLAALVANIQATFGAECLPVNLPAKNGTAITKCLINNKGESDILDVASVHQAILDQVVEVDETLMEKYLSGEEPNFEALHDPFEKCMDEGHVVPILFVNAKDGVGVAELTGFIGRWFPSPLEGNSRPMYIGEGNDEKLFEVREDANGAMLAHVFKVTSDPFVGKLAIFRVHAGTLTGQSQIVIGHSKKPIKLGHVFHLQGKTHHEVNAIVAGDIGAVAKIEEIHLNDVLHDDHALDAVHMKRDPMPVPMYSLAISPKDRGDEAKMSGLLTKFAEEDPTFRWTTDRNTHEVIISGMGELHLRFALERLENRGLHVDTKPPKIAYKETILGNAEGHHRHKKQTGGSGQFGEVYLRVEPLPEDSIHHTSNGGEGFEFVDDIFGGTIPGQYIPAVEKGVRDVMETGAIAGYALTNVRCTVYDGKHHPVDSKEVAFRAAGKWAFIDAVRKAKPTLLEPIVKLEVLAPEDKIGTITGDLSGKRGRILTTDSLPGGVARVEALAPLSELLLYNAQLKSVTGGRGSYAMDLSHYDPAPAQVQQAKINEWKPASAED